MAAEEELFGSPITMACSTGVDAFAGGVGGAVETADVDGAYLQADLRGKPKYPELPSDMWLPEWKGKYRRPAVPIKKALCGLQRAGFDWQDHAGNELVKEGWKRLVDVERNMFTKEFWGGRVVAGLYVDDIKMAGRQEGMEQAWDSVGACFKFGDAPEKIEKFTGLWHESRKCGDGKTEWKTHQEPHAQQVLQKYMDDAGISELGLASTPGTQMGQSELAEDTPGEFSDACRKHVGSLMFLARGSRPDILYTVGWLARCVTNWTKTQDKMLRQLVKHINSTAGFGPVGTVGNSSAKQKENLWVELYADADLAGCHETSRSTSGGAMILKGDQGTSSPIDWFSKRQTVVSRSTGEAELVAINDALVNIGLGNHSILESILDTKLPFHVFTDSSAAKSAVEDGYGRMKCTKRTHRISIGWVKDLVGSGLIELKKMDGASNVADAMTKFLGRSMQNEGVARLGIRRCGSGAS